MSIELVELEKDIVYSRKHIEPERIEKLYSRMSQVEYNSTRLLDEFDIDPDVKTPSRDFYRAMCDEYATIQRILKLKNAYDNKR